MNPKHKPLRSVDEALMALDMDSLALVTYTATEVFVTTAFGAGKFSKKAWDAAKAPKNSLEDNGGRAS